MLVDRGGFIYPSQNLCRFFNILRIVESISPRLWKTKKLLPTYKNYYCLFVFVLSAIGVVRTMYDVRYLYGLTYLRSPFAPAVFFLVIFCLDHNFCEGKGFLKRIYVSREKSDPSQPKNSSLSITIGGAEGR